MEASLVNQLQIRFDAGTHHLVHTFGGSREAEAEAKMIQFLIYIN